MSLEDDGRRRIRKVMSPENRCQCIVHHDHLDLYVDGRAGCNHHGPSMSGSMAAASAPTTEARNFDHLDLGGDVSSGGDAPANGPIPRLTASSASR